MFETNETITGMVDGLFSACKGLKRGDYLTHGTVAAIVGTEPHVAPWPQVMKRLRRRIEDERGITLWPENGVGYRLLTEHEQLTMVPAKRRRRALRQIRRAERSLMALPARGLSLHQKRLRALLSESLGRSRQGLLSEAGRQGAFARKTETLPRMVPATV